MWSSTIEIVATQQSFTIDTINYMDMVVSGVLAVPLIASDVAEVYSIVYDYSK